MTDMPQAKQKSARLIAAEVLARWNPAGQDLAESLHKAAASLQDARERRLAAELVLGTARNRSAIDLVLTALAGIDTRRVPARTLNILRTAGFELLFHPETPPYAVINEAAAAARGKKPTGFVNAVLRQITRSITCRQTDLTPSDPRKTIPTDVETGCTFDKHLLPDPHTRPADYLSKAFSLPAWLIQTWLDEFGFRASRRICLAANRRPSIYLRPNTLKASPVALLEKLHAADIDCRLSADRNLIKLDSRLPVTELAGFDQGLFTIQDPASTKPVRALALKPDRTVLDLCAAPGTKTCQMAELMKNTGKIYGTDIDAARLKKVTENCRRLGVTNVQIVDYNALQKSKVPAGPFDAVLIDAPCSNTAVLARRCEVRYRIRKDTPERLAKTQMQLLQLAAGLLKDGGRICYSTCSLQATENSDLVATFMANNPAFAAEQHQLTLPSPDHDDHDGGYYAILRHK